MFGDHPFVVLKIHTDSECKNVDQIVGERVYRNLCMTSGTESYRYLVRADWTIDYEQYTAPNCVGERVVSTRIRSEDVYSNKCIGGTTYYIDSRATFSRINGYFANVYYGDDSCSRPTHIHFEPRMVYDSPTVARSSCEQQSSGVFLKREFASDYKQNTKKIFDDWIPYMIEEQFKDWDCSIDKGASVYRADGKCIDTGDVSGIYSLINTGYSVKRYKRADCSDHVLDSYSSHPQDWV